MAVYKLREGLRVALARVEGITEPGILEQSYFFQCPPLEEFTVEHAFSHTDYDTVRRGQYSRRGGRQLRQLSFDTLVVDWGTYTLLADAEDMSIEEHTEALERVLYSGTPFLLTVSHESPLNFETLDAEVSLALAGPELQMTATLRTLRVTERAGEGDARYLGVGFTEYRDPVIERTGRTRSGKRAGGRRYPISGAIVAGSGVFRYGKTTVRKPVTTKVTLAYLAAYFYGRPEGARHIAAHNRITSWGFNTPLVDAPRFRAGGPLTIPAPPDEAG